MNISQDGIDLLIKQFEGVSLKPYICPAGIKTIGYGHVILPNENFIEISLKQANEILKKDLLKFDKIVSSLLKIEVSQSQFDALVSLCFNIGETAFKNSTLLKKLNAYSKL